MGIWSACGGAVRGDRIMRSGLLVSVVSLLIVGVPLAVAAGVSRCSIINNAAANSYTSLQAAVDAASPGAALLVRGRCIGVTMINKSLSITGQSAAGSGSPTLDGGGGGSVLTVGSGVSVTITSLTITNGNAALGGGIHNYGSVTLDASTMTGNTASGDTPRGGAIYNDGGGTSVVLQDGTTIKGNDSQFAGGGVSVGNGGLTVKDTSSISGNTAAYYGGGVAVAYGSVTLQDKSSVQDNTDTYYEGGGIYDFDGTVILSDSSSVHDNGAPDGAGIFVNGGGLTLSGKSTVHDNAATDTGGGIYEGGGTVSGANAGSNVYNNTPNDIAP
jgi:hypothetical protein